MKWRCPQCGKPHERNDPPCENCGHHKFERAVVPTASGDEDREQFVWACSKCGRHHQRNNPPCSRCGNPDFEKKPLEYDDFDPGDTKGYRELIGRQEVGLSVVVVVLIGVGLLGFFGVVNIPGITPQGPPTVEEVPGDSDRIDSVALSDVEREMLTDIDQRREGQSLRRDDGLDQMATYHVRLTAKALIQNEQPDTEREDYERFETPCDGLPNFSFGQTIVSGTGEATATSIADGLSLRTGSDTMAPTESRFSAVGIGSHAGPDGTVYVVVLYC